MDYLQKNGRLSRDYQVYRAHMSMDGKRLSILATDSRYSTDKFRERNARAESCIIRENQVDIGGSQTTYNAEVAPLIEDCVTRSRASVPGLNHKTRLLTQEEAGELRASYLRNRALDERQMSLRAEFTTR